MIERRHTMRRRKRTDDPQPGGRVGTPKQMSPPKLVQPWDRIRHQEVVITLRGGILIEGTLTDYLSGFLVLENVTVHGSKHRTQVPWLWLERAVISHLHPAPENVQEMED